MLELLHAIASIYLCVSFLMAISMIFMVMAFADEERFSGYTKLQHLVACLLIGLLWPWSVREIVGLYGEWRDKRSL